MDIWGRIYADHWRGERHPHAFVRDDGTRNVVESAAGYFEAPRSAAEEAACKGLGGKVLDLGCGPGSYSLFLEEHRVHAVAVDSSPGAIRVCRKRGCQDTRVSDFRRLTLGDERFDALICTGNTIGIGQTPSTFVTLLAGLQRLLKIDGRFVLSGVDPLATTVPDRIEYQEKNRARGLPPALVRAKLEYRGDRTDWWILWIPTEEEFAAAATAAGWKIESLEREGAGLVWVLRPDG